MTPAEIAHIPAGSGGWHFLRLWTAKEAAVKAIGHGFATPPGDFAIDWHGDKPTTMIAERHLFGQLQKLDDKHLLAVMTDRDSVRL